MRGVTARAVFGLVATNDDAAALLARLEAMVSERKLDVTDPVVSWALERHGSVSGAAKFLGVPRSTLRYALRKAAAS